MERAPSTKGRKLGRGVVWGVLVAVLGLIMFLPLFTLGKRTPQRAECLRNMRQMQIAAIFYAQRHGNTLPDLSSAAAIKSALGIYLPDAKFLACPENHLAFRGNAALSGKNPAQIPNSMQVVLFYEDDGVYLQGKNVVYVGGQAKWLSDQGWQIAKAESGIR